MTWIKKERMTSQGQASRLIVDGFLKARATRDHRCYWWTTSQGFVWKWCIYTQNSNWIGKMVISIRILGYLIYSDKPKKREVVHYASELSHRCFLRCSISKQLRNWTKHRHFYPLSQKKNSTDGWMDGWLDGCSQLKVNSLGDHFLHPNCSQVA